MRIRGRVLGWVLGFVIPLCSCTDQDVCEGIRAERDEAERRLSTVLIQYEALAQEVERLRALVEELQGRSPFGYSPDSGDAFVPLHANDVGETNPIGHTRAAADHTSSLVAPMRSAGVGPGECMRCSRPHL
jgi:hypothetical protein